MGDLGAPPTPFGDHPAVEGTRPPQPTLPDEINPTRSFEVPATSRSLLLSLCPQTLPSSPPKPSWALSLLRGAAAAVVQPHLCLIFQAKPHLPVGRRGCSGKPRGSRGRSQMPGSGCGHLARRKVGLEGHGLSTTGLGQRQEKAPPPACLEGPSQEQAQHGPGEGMTRSWKHVLL